MQKSGAIAVIIGNYIENTRCKIQVLGKDENLLVRIPALLIQRLDYLSLLKLVEDQKGVLHVKLVRDKTDDPGVNIFLVVFVWPFAMIGIFYAALYLHNVWIVYKKKKESKYAISNTAIRIYQDDEPQETWCCICLEYYENGDHVKYLRCDHVYHQSCIDEWLYYSCVCPLCKMEVVG